MGTGHRRRSSTRAPRASSGNYRGPVLRRLLRLVFRAGLVGGAVAAVAKVAGNRRSSAPGAPASGPLPREAWPPLQPDKGDRVAAGTTDLAPDPEAPSSAPPPTEEVPLAPAPEVSEPTQAPAPAPTDAGPDPIAESDVAWVEPDGDVCPTTHPVKAKLASKIFHVPGGLSYARTRPDRCYRDVSSAEADGLRPAKR